MPKADPTVSIPRKGNNSAGDRILLTLVALLCAVFLVAVWIWPNSFLWGVHSLAFLPFPLSLTLVILALLLALPPMTEKYGPWLERLAGAWSAGGMKRLVFCIVAGILSAAAFYLFRNEVTMYGDERTLLTVLGSKVYSISDIFRLEDYAPLTRFLHQPVASLAGLDQRTAIALTSEVVGGVVISLLFWFATSLDGPGAWKIFILAVSLLLAVLSYFYIFHAAEFAGNSGQERVSKIFLPLRNYLPDPHHYTLFSLNHLSDVVQESLLVVSPGAVLVLLLSLAGGRKRWGDPKVIFFALGALYLLVFDFSVNPLLSPMRDWDFLSLVSAPVVYLAMALSRDLFARVASGALGRRVVGVALGGLILPVSFIAVNARAESGAARLRGIGEWAFRSYYIGSAYIINAGCLMISDMRHKPRSEGKSYTGWRATRRLPTSSLAY